MFKKHTALNLLFSTALSLFIICLGVKFTLAFKPLYYFDINHLDIVNTSGMNLNKETIKHNYDVLIDYTQNSSIKKLTFPNFAMSKEGEIHFSEVKNIFIKINYLFYITGVISFIGILLGLRERRLDFLKLSSIFTLAFPTVLMIPFAINFDKSFTVFHKLFFNNDYWEFDPKLDPIINVLPQEFFMHCAVLILFIIAASSLITFIIYKKYKRKNRRIFS